MTRPNRRTFRFVAISAATVGLIVGTLSPAYAEALGGIASSTLGREALQTPSDAADASPGDLQYADPTAGLAGIDPPVANSSGDAQVSYPLALPEGRGLTPDLALAYDSGGGSGWVGQGWSLGVGEVSVDTTFGVPKFCPRTTAPACGDYESESYRLDGDLLMPTATTASPEPRVADRADFTRKVETEYEQIIRHGDSPKNYFWEVRDKAGNVRWYGGYPDQGGPAGGPGTRTGAARNDLTQDPDAVRKDSDGNVVAWYLTAERDVGVNMIRYEYDVETYEAKLRADGKGSNWQPVGSCDSGEACAEHVYLKRILYTGAAEASGHDENPGYRIDFVRDGTRTDPVIDASSGALDVDQEKLTTVRVRAHDSQQLLSEYRLAYKKGSFGKQLLTSVTQVGCDAAAGCDESTAATHDFTYFDEADGWADSTSWSTGSDNLAGIDGTVEGNSGPLGMSSSIGGDGHIYLGFNPTAPTKAGSFGGALTFDGADTNSLSEFMDINGDSLPDKVFRDPDDFDTIQYRLNLSTPSDGLDAAVSFSGVKTLSGLTTLPKESEFGITGGVEAYFGVALAFHAGGSWNWSDGYFSDVNGDGLPDFVKSGSVLFNHLDCTADPCEPTFASGDGQTRHPLDVTDVNHPSDTTLADQLDQLRELSPPIDTVRRWVAPYDGSVTIGSTASLVAPDSSDETVRVAIQHNGTELAHDTLSGSGDAWVTTHNNLSVTAGDRLYFRVSPVTDVEQSSVDWAPTITYAADPPTDANGLSQKEFDAAADFTLAGRPGGFVGLPDGGTMRFSGVLEKEHTSDDVLPTLTHDFWTAGKDTVDETVTVTPLTDAGAVDADRQKSVEEDSSSGEYCVVTGAGTSYGCYGTEAEAEAQLPIITTGETGRFRVTAEFDADAPQTENGQITDQDMVQARLAVDSPIDATALRWTTVANLCYLDAGACDDGKPNVDVPVDTDIYPEVNRASPISPWQPNQTNDRKVVATVQLADDNPAGSMVLTVKDADGTVKDADGSVAKKRVDVADGTDADLITGSRSVSVTVDFEADADYWFDVSVADPALADAIMGLQIEVERDDPEKDPTDVPSSLNSTGRQGYFPLPYRGWGVAGYRGDGGRRTSAIKEGNFRLGKDDGSAYDDKDEACNDLNGEKCLTKSSAKNKLGFPSSYDGSGDPEFDTGAAKDQIEDVYSFVPTRTADDAGALTYAWTGPKEEMYGTATGVGASVLGDVIPTIDSASGSIPAPTLSGRVSPTLALTAGLGPLSASLGVGWSQSDADYIDMNGDGFPDVVRPDSIIYTDPRGGTACRQDETTYAACDGSGPDDVNTDTTFSVGGGFDGSPVSIKANSRGAANSTKGKSAGKSDDAAKGEYGAGVGIGASVSASWSSPTTGQLSGDDYDADTFTDAVPGADGSTLQRTLSDINGDGLPDRIRSTWEDVFVRLGTGYGFAPEIKWATGALESGESYSGALALGLGFSGYMRDYSGGVSRNAAVNFPRYSWSDVNGDGIVDALYKDGDKIKVAFGTGAGVGSPAVYGNTQRVDFDIVGDVDAQTGDQIRQDTSVGYGGGFDFTLGFGPICVVACYIIVNPGAHVDGSQTLTDIDLTDVNGDGFADSVSRGADDSELEVRLNTQGRTGLLKSVDNPLGGSFALDYTRRGNTVDHPGSVWAMSKVTVDDGRSGDGPDQATSTFSYGDLGYDFVNRTSLGFDAVTTRELATDDTTVLRATKEAYSNDSIFDAGLLTSTTLYDGDVASGNRVQTSTSSWEILDGESGDPLDATQLSADQLLAAWATPRLSESGDAWFDKGDTDPGLSTATEYSYDSLGNPVEIIDRGDPDVTEDDVTAEIAYSDCTISASDALATACASDDDSIADQPAYWHDDVCPTWVSMPAEVTVTDADDDVLRHRDGSPALCDNGAVTELTELIDGAPGSGDVAVTRLGFDEFGSYNRIVYPADAQDRHYGVFYRYDDARFTGIARITDYQLDGDEVDDFLDADTTADDPPAAADHVGLTSTTSFDADSGAETISTDPNGQSTTYAYDALGRLTRTTLPDGGYVSYAYHPTDADYAYAVAQHSDEFHANDTIDTVTFVDGVGRTTEQKREADLFDGAGSPSTNTFVVSGAVTYDVLGREVKQAYPIPASPGTAKTEYDAGSADEVKKLAYDVYDRVTRSTSPSGLVTTTEYDFAEVDGLAVGATKVTDPLGRASRTLVDIRGYTHAVDDIAGGDALRTSYDVDLLGQVLSVTAAGATQAEHSYDLLGRRTSTSTQDGGTVDYGYDAAGNQVTEQSSVQRADDDSRTEYSYSFGNLVGIDYPDATPDVTLAWGGYDGATTDGNGAGRLVEVTDAARHQTLEYDVNGFRAAENTEMVDDHWKMGTLRTETDHDWLGRVASIGYPDGETVSNDYDRGGSLESVTGTKACTDLGTLAAAVDDAQTTITVVENPLDAPPSVPFTIRIGDEQLRVTARVAGATAGEWVYTVERGINGTVDVPTVAAHDAGAAVTSDDPLVCRYRYLDRRAYDEFARNVFEQVGNGNRTARSHLGDGRLLERVRTTAPALGGRELQDLQYEYDDVGNVLSYDNALPEDEESLMGGPSSQTYEYDDRYRLVSAAGTWEQAPHTLRQYTYDVSYDDATGNLLAKSQRDWEERSTCKKKCKESEVEENTFALDPVTYTADHQHRVESQGAGEFAETLTHDLDGNVTSITTEDVLREMSWDSEGRMTMIVDRPNGTGGKPTYYAYDWQGYRAFEHKEQGRSWFVNPYVTVENGTTWKNYFADDQMIGTKFSQEDSFEQKVYFQHRDLQGSTNIVTDRTGEIFQHHEYFPDGQVWIDEKSTIFRTPYQFAGDYFDEDHDLSDLGQRWYDSRRSMLYAVEPATFADPATLVDHPALASAYTYAYANPVTYTDPDGALPLRVNPTQVRELERSLRTASGSELSLSQRVRLQKFFSDHTGLGGRIAYSSLKLLQKQQAKEAKQKAKYGGKTFEEKYGFKPLLEISLEKGDSGWKLQNIKLSLGAGKRAKLDFASEGPGDISISPPLATNAQAPPPPPPAGWKPTTSAASSTSQPVNKTSATGSSNGGQ